MSVDSLQMEQISDRQVLLQELVEKARSWNATLHKMRLFTGTEDLQDTLAQRPLLLIVGKPSVAIWASEALNFQPFSSSLAAPIKEQPAQTQEPGCLPSILEFMMQKEGPHFLGKIRAGTSTDLQADLVFLDDPTGLPPRTQSLLRDLLGSADLLVSDRTFQNLWRQLGGHGQAPSNPQCILVAEGGSDTVVKSIPAVPHQITLPNSDAAIQYLQMLPDLWPCLLAQRLERSIGGYLQQGIPLLIRRRKLWVAGVLLLDFLVIGGLLQLIRPWQYFSHVHPTQWSSLPSLLAAAGLFSLILLGIFGVFLLWRLHRGSCWLCTVLFSCSMRSGDANRNRLRRAFQESTRDFIQTLTCPDLCGWKSGEKQRAAAFCAYCSRIQRRMEIPTPPLSKE